MRMFQSQHWITDELGMSGICAVELPRDGMKRLVSKRKVALAFKPTPLD